MPKTHITSFILMPSKGKAGRVVVTYPICMNGAETELAKLPDSKVVRVPDKTDCVACLRVAVRHGLLGRAGSP